MADLESMTLDELKKTLLGLRKQRRKLENELEETLKSSNPPVTNKRAQNNEEMKTILAAKALINRAGVSVTQSKVQSGGDSEITLIKFTNWHKGELKGQTTVKILSRERGFSIVQHNIPFGVCSLTGRKKLPLQFEDKDKNFDVINTIKMSVSAYYNRLNQFKEFVEEYPHSRFVWESHCQNAELIIPLKADKNFKVVVTLEYSEIAILPKTVSCSFSEDLDEKFTGDFTKQLLIFKEEYLIDAYKQILDAGEVEPK